MRRAVVQVLRTARRSHATRFISLRSSSSSLTRQVNVSAFRAPLSPRNPQFTILHSSMYFRGLTIAVLSSLVASGAWFAYREKPSESALQRQSFSTSASLFSPNTNSLVSSSPTSTLSDPTIAQEVTASTPAQQRKALVVDNDQFFTGDITGDEPLIKEVDASGRLVLEMLTPDQATSILRQHEQSYLIGRGQGVLRYDYTQLASNNPIEDDHVEKILEIPDTVTPASNGSKPDWMFWGVFDGHSGWTTSAKLRQVLVNHVARELNTTYKAAMVDSAANLPSPEAIDAAIKRGFVQLDNEIVHESVKKAAQAKSKNAAVELLAPALSGSCALLSFYDSSSKTLRVACTGDSRAVLGRRSTKGKWTATPLSVDQTGATPSEIMRLQKEHPGEPNVAMNGRVLGGLEPTRAFGDAIYKWSTETAKNVKKQFFGRTPPPTIRTPPYVTAEPVVTTTKVEPDNGDFLVMATDGLWECLTNEEVVGLVGQWLDGQQGKSSSFASWSNWFSGKASLPVEGKSGGSKKSGDGQRPTIRQEQWQLGNDETRFVLEDKNVATHIIRNALGGKNREMVCALLSLPSPYSRRYRDDLTVQVIFFGSGAAGGGVVQNLEASNNPTAGQPKL